MLCASCGKSVPDESAFCLACGARLAATARLAPSNGGTAPAPAPAPAAAGSRAGTEVRAPAAPAALTPPGSARQAYALSFRPIADERLRYRLARWVCERAPAHTMTEVQEGLERGAFFTFLALTAAEAGTTQQGIEALGVASTLVSLAPATTADLMRSAAGPAREASGRRTMKPKDWAAVALAVVLLFIFGFVVIRMFGGRGF
jgi:zinc-ribbon domain